MYDKVVCVKDCAFDKVVCVTKLCEKELYMKDDSFVRVKALLCLTK